MIMKDFYKLTFCHCHKKLSCQRRDKLKKSSRINRQPTGNGPRWCDKSTAARIEICRNL